jgi:thioredoxin reductase (NADPH)
MSMFDYDARPVTPFLVLIGTTASRGAYAIRDFLSRNGYPFERVDVGQPDAVRAVLGSRRSRAVMVRSSDGDEGAQLRAEALFVCIGGLPRTDSATRIGLATNASGYLVTGSDLGDDPKVGWPLARELLPLETNLPGVFAAGDVRCGSVKRCSAAIGEGSMAGALVHHRLAEIGDA